MNAPGLLSIRFASPEHVERLQALLQAWPDTSRLATQRALRQFSNWARVRIFHEIQRATGLSSQTLQLLVRTRYRANQRDNWLSIWLGTNAVPATILGTVRWRRAMPGAQAGGHLFPGSWSWADAVATAGMVMRRSGRFGRVPRRPAARRTQTRALERIEQVPFGIHPAIRDAVLALQGEFEAQFEQLLWRELTRALEDLAA